MQEEALLSKLDELITALKAAAIPVTERWLDAAGVGALLSQNRAYVLQRLASLPDFPEANRVGQPRWKASEVLQWMEDTRDGMRDGKRKPGRKRLR